MIKPSKTFEDDKQAEALLKMMEMSEQNFRDGKFKPAQEALDDIKKRVRTRLKK